MGLSIQFRSREQVLQAYENRDVEAWSLWCSKQFLFKGIGQESLKAMLDVLCNGATNAIYTLRIYEGIDNEREIKSNTPDDGSFNFRLNDEGQSLTPEQISRTYNGNAILSKLEVITNRLDEIESREDQEPEKDNSAIGKILEHPAIAGILPIILERVASAIMGGNEAKTGRSTMPVLTRPNATINGVPGESQDLTPEIKNVVKELMNFDENLLQHLHKLLELAQTNRTLFNTLINSL
jgi:hypothetical protein